MAPTHVVYVSPVFMRLCARGARGGAGTRLRAPIVPRLFDGVRTQRDGICTPLARFLLIAGHQLRVIGLASKYRLNSVCETIIASKPSPEFPQYPVTPHRMSIHVAWIDPDGVLIASLNREFLRQRPAPVAKISAAKRSWPNRCAQRDLPPFLLLCGSKPCPRLATTERRFR